MFNNSVVILLTLILCVGQNVYGVEPDAFSAVDPGAQIGNQTSRTDISQCPKYLISDWIKELNRGALFVAKPIDGCERYVTPFSRFGAKNGRVSLVALENYILKEPAFKTQIANYRVGPCITSERDGFHRNKDKIDETLQGLTSMFYLTKFKIKNALGTKERVLADLDYLTGKPILSGVKCYKSPDCEVFRKCKTSKPREEFVEQVKIASASQAFLNPDCSLRDRSKAQHAKILVSLYPWLAEGSHFCNSMKKKDWDRSTIAIELEKYFEKLRNKHLEEYSEFETTAKCLEGSDRRECHSKGIDEVLEKTPPVDFEEVLSSESRENKELKLLLYQASCYRGYSEDVRLSNGTAQGLITDIGLLVSVIGIEAVIAKAAVTVGRVVISSASSARMVSAGIKIASASTKSAKVISRIVDLAYAASGGVEAIRGCAHVLNQWDGAFDELGQARTQREIISHACPGESPEQVASRAIMSDLGACLAGVAVQGIPPGLALLGKTLKAAGRKIPKSISNPIREAVKGISSSKFNQAFKTLTEAQFKKYHPDLVMHIEFSVLKEINNKSAALADDIRNQYFKILNEEFEASTRLQGAYLAEYNGFKEMRVGFKGDPSQIASEITDLEERVSKRFAEWVSDQSIASKLGESAKRLSDPDKWFFFGTGKSELEAELTSRFARSVSGKGVRTFTQVKQEMKESLETLAKLSKGLENGKLSQDVLEAFRASKNYKPRGEGAKGTADYLNHVGKEIKHRAGKYYTSEELTRMKEYYTELDRWMVGELVGQKMSITVPKTGGYFAGDLSGIGAKNMYAAQDALKSSDPLVVAKGIRDAQAQVTKDINANIGKIVAGGKRVGLDVSVMRSGDDLSMTFSGLKRQLSETEQEKFVAALGEQGIGKDLRLMFVPDQMGGKALSQERKQEIASALSALEKKMRATEKISPSQIICLRVNSKTSKVEALLGDPSNKAEILKINSLISKELINFLQ